MVLSARQRRDPISKPGLGSASTQHTPFPTNYYKPWKDSVLRGKYGHALGSPDGLTPLTTVVCIKVNEEVTTYICL